MKVADLRSSRYATFQLNDSGQVAWTQEDGEQSQIYMYGDSLVSIATSQGPVPILLFNDLGQIVWLTTDENDSKLNLYSGGEITQISNGFTAPLYPHINKQGQIVFVAREDNGYQVLLYEDGQISNLTDENGDYAAPQISDNGQVAWFGAEEEVLHVYLYTNGVIEKINENEKFTLDKNIYNRRINNLGQVVWSSDERDDFYDDIINFYDGTRVVKLKPMVHNQNPTINNNGQVVWQGWDGNDHEIFLYTGGEIIQVVDNEDDDGFPVINDQGIIAWEGSDGNDLEIFTYDNGIITQLTDNTLDDFSPQINNNGQVAWLTKNSNGDLQGLFRTDPGTGHIINSNAGSVMESTLTPWVRMDAASNSDSTLPQEEQEEESRVLNEVPDEESNSIPPRIPLDARDASSRETDNDPLFSFVVMGDSRLSTGWVPGAHKFPHAFVSDLAGKMIALAEQSRLPFVVFLGDMCTFPQGSGGLYLDTWFDTFFDPLIQNFIQVFPVMGNHETYDWVQFHKTGKWNQDQAQFSLEAFGIRMRDAQMSDKIHILNGNGNYYFDYPFHAEEGQLPNSRFFVVNFYTEDPGTNNSGYIDEITLMVLELEITRAKKDGIKNIFVFGHPPLYANTHKNVEKFKSFLFDYQVRAYFAGHIHQYRHGVIYKDSPSSAPFFHEIVTGAAGADLDGPSSFSWVPKHSDMFYSVARRFNYVLVEVYEQEIWVTTYITKDDLFKANNKSLPQMIAFERFRIMQNGENVEHQQMYCNGPAEGPKPYTPRGDVIWCRDFTE
jgi:hypothetical protein